MPVTVNTSRQSPTPAHEDPALLKGHDSYLPAPMSVNAIEVTLEPTQNFLVALVLAVYVAGRTNDFSSQPFH